MVSTKHIVGTENKTYSCNKRHLKSIWPQRSWLILPEGAGKVSLQEVASDLGLRGEYTHFPDGEE